MPFFRICFETTVAMSIRVNGFDIPSSDLFLIYSSKDALIEASRSDNGSANSILFKIVLNVVCLQ